MRGLLCPSPVASLLAERSSPPPHVWEVAFLVLGRRLLEVLFLPPRRRKVELNRQSSSSFVEDRRISICGT